MTTLPARRRPASEPGEMFWIALPGGARSHNVGEVPRCREVVAAIWRTRHPERRVFFGCGIGHVLSSIVIGFIGIGLGLAVGRLEIFEGARGNDVTECHVWATASLKPLIPVVRLFRKIVFIRRKTR